MLRVQPTRKTRGWLFGLRSFSPFVSQNIKSSVKCTQKCPAVAGLFCALAFSVSVMESRRKMSGHHFLHLFCLPQSFIHSVAATLPAKTAKPSCKSKPARHFSRSPQLNLARLLGRLGCVVCHSFLHVARSSPPLRTQKLTPNTCVVHSSSFS